MRCQEYFAMTPHDLWPWKQQEGAYLSYRSRKSETDDIFGSLGGSRPLVNGKGQLVTGSSQQVPEVDSKWPEVFCKWPEEASKWSVVDWKW